MQINWKARIKNKYFWLTIIPATLLLIQTVLAAFGVSFDFTILEAKLVAIVDAVFGLLAMLGIVVDLTTNGISDTNLAMTYNKPRKDE